MTDLYATPAHKINCKTAGCCLQNNSRSPSLTYMKWDCYVPWKTYHLFIVNRYNVWGTRPKSIHRVSRYHHNTNINTKQHKKQHNAMQQSLCTTQLQNMHFHRHTLSRLFKSVATISLFPPSDDQPVRPKMLYIFGKEALSSSQIFIVPP